jgi:hypothetical protein
MPGASWLVLIVCLDYLERELLQLAEQAAQFPGVVEQGLPGGELLGGEPPGDGPAADLAGPLGVGAVQLRRVGVAAAAALFVNLIGAPLGGFY